MNYKVSIIVPVYNVEKYIARCLDSIINQSYDNIEIIVVNDGSTDNSLDIIKKNYSSYNKVFIFNKTNGGLSSARNFGLKKISGDYVLFVDSDDWISQNCVELLMNEIETSKADIVEFGYELVFDNKKSDVITFAAQKIEGNKNILEEFFYGTQITDIVCNKIYRKSLFDNVEFVEGRIHEDYMIMPKLLFSCKKISIIEESLYFYYQRDDSITQKPFSDKNFDRLFAGDYVINFCKENAQEFYDISLIRKGYICIYMYNQLLISSLSDNYINYKRNIVEEFNNIYIKTFRSKSLKKLPFAKRMLFKMFWLNKTITIHIYRFLRG